MTARSITLMLLVSALSIACESTRVTESVQPWVAPPVLDPSVFTTLEVLPSTVTLEQGWTVQLEIVARDQRGVLMAVSGGLTFSSSDAALATVSGSGMVTGVAAGTADISVTKTVAGVTRSAEMKATILQTDTASLCATATPCFAFAREGAVFTTAFDDSPPARLVEDATRPAWSADGSMIAFTRPNKYVLAKWQMCISERDGTRIRCAVSDEDGIVVGGPSWSPDGTLVAFSVFVYSCPAGQCGQLGGSFSRVKMLDTRTMQVTSVGAHEVQSLAWSPDGRRIAFAAWGAGPFGRGALHVMNADGSNVQFLGASLGSYSVVGIAWSPDGGRLALALNNENACPWYCDTALGVVNVDGTGLQVLATARTSFPGRSEDRYIDFPAWSADGSRLAYTVSGSCYESEPGCPTEIRGRDFESGDSYVLVPNAAGGSWLP